MTTVTPDLSDDHKLVDSVVYLASLSSRTEAIDPALDTLREITSNWDSTTPLSNQSRATLRRLIADLKTRLVNDDPLRNFTAEELDAKLAFALAGKKNKLPNIAAVLAGCAALASTVFFLPNLSLAAKMDVSVVTFMAFISAFNVWLYVSSLKNFKPELRKIYVYESIGFGIIGLQFIHFIVISATGIADEPLYKYFGTTEITLMAFVFMYMGMVQYARVLNVSAKKTNWQLTGTLAVITVVSIIVGLLRGVEHPIIFTASLLSLFYIGATSIYAAILARKLLKVLTANYAKPLHGLYIFFLVVPTSVVGDTGSLIWLGHVSVGNLGPILSVVASAAMLTLLFSGYNFKKSSLR